MVKVMIETDSGEIHENLKADSRGRVTLGSEYANETVSIAVVKQDDA